MVIKDLLRLPTRHSREVFVRSPLRYVQFAGLALLLSACGGDSRAPTDPTSISFSGSYNLQSINGGKLPYVALQQGQNSITVTSDLLLVADGGSWSEILNLVVVSNGVSSTQVGSDSGTWLRSGNSLVFASTKNNDVAYTGTFSNNRLDLISGTSTFVFTK